MNKSRLTDRIYMHAHDYEPDRIARIERTLIYVLAFGLGRGLITLHSNPIVAAMDHKGTLTIIWSDLSMMKQLGEISSEAWSVIGREPGICVCHKTTPPGCDWLTILLSGGPEC